MQVAAQVELRVVALDSTIVKVHPDGTGALKKTARRPSASRVEGGPPRFIWLPRMSDKPWGLPSRPASVATGRKAAN